mmetsp:Transcript_8119/g.8315  ORF Transcript_8119/g.8315 Transcript_8119/m.8315 type:complete len:99 (-) Transcript_8119:867-1163(-)
MLDHGTGIVIGETARLGHECTFLHGVTLDGTGNAIGDRHPKIGNHVLIGANVSVLGNIKVGDNSKIGAGIVESDSGLLRRLLGGLRGEASPGVIWIRV